MSYSTNPIQDAERHHAKIQARDSLIDQAERDVYEQFMAAALAGDANAVCRWAPMVRDFDRPPGPGGERRKRCQTFAEILDESTDTRAVQQIEVFQLLLNAANGADVKAQALDLLQRSGQWYAWMHGKNLEETT
jgi:hypothetical protein